ncbi:MAG: hypothetical protein EOP06_24255 [Proteobacteria bacterium]|nr:MAG: hypothetical protein EOP06_24255 [Pseudomonadota bacterium]
MRAALTDLNFVLSKAPDLITALHARANVYLYLKEIPSSVVDFNRLRTLSPTHVDSARLGSKLALAKNKLPEAELWLKFAIASSKTPDQKASGLSDLASFYSDISKTKEAIATYQELLKIRTGDAWTYNNLSAVQNMSGDFEGAIISAKKALGLADFGVARHNLSEALCSKSQALFEMNKDPKLLKANSIEIEKPLFEALSDTPDHRGCLSRAARYYEFRVRYLDERQSAGLATEYYERLSKASRWPPHYMAFMSMNAIKTSLEKGAPPQIINNLQWPTDVLAMIEKQRVPAAVKPAGAKGP